MTLNITMLTRQTIYQSADFRLTDLSTKRVYTDTSMKLVILQCKDWGGFVSYTGIGSCYGRDTSEYIVEWLTGLGNATFEEIAVQLYNRGTKWLTQFATDYRQFCRHTFILAGFVGDKPQVSLISNYEDLVGRNDPRPAPKFTVTQKSLCGSALVIVTGQKRAVNRYERRLLERLVRSGNEDPAHVRRRLAEINRTAAVSPMSNNTVSAACAVVSIRADGSGTLQSEGPVDMRQLMMGIPVPDFKEIAKQLGLSAPILVGMKMATSRPPISYAPCKPKVISPDKSSVYKLQELSHAEYSSCVARDVNETDIVHGASSTHDRPGDWAVWTSPADGTPTLCGFYGRPGGLNDDGMVAVSANTLEGTSCAVRWEGGLPTELGCHKGIDSSAVAINGSGFVVGSVCIDKVDRGQRNFRPAAWTGTAPVVLENFECEWGEAVDVNDEGVVLVSGHVGSQTRAILWFPSAGTWEIVGGRTGIGPVAISADRVVLGTANNHEYKPVAWVARYGDQWERLGTDPGFYATAMNDRGDIVGAAVREGYERPWLRSASGDIVWLPYLDQHWCRPSAISNSGLIVGTAQTDHGFHALVWTKKRS